MTVVSVPGTPATPTVELGDSKVTVTAGTTGGIPTRYTVTPTPATTPPITCTVTGASGSCDVTGLADGTAYTFTATATNTVDTSDASDPSLPVTTAYAVGTTGPSGGKVFYVATTPFNCGPMLTSTCTYLEAAPSDAANSKWCSVQTLPVISTSMAIGAGSSNARLMLYP